MKALISKVKKFISSLVRLEEDYCPGVLSLLYIGVRYYEPKKYKGETKGKNFLKIGLFGSKLLCVRIPLFVEDNLNETYRVGWGKVYIRLTTSTLEVKKLKDDRTVHFPWEKNYLRTEYGVIPSLISPITEFGKLDAEGDKFSYFIIKDNEDVITTLRMSFENIIHVRGGKKNNIFSKLSKKINHYRYDAVLGYPFDNEAGGWKGGTWGCSGPALLANNNTVKDVSLHLEYLRDTNFKDMQVIQCIGSSPVELTPERLDRLVENFYQETPEELKLYKQMDSKKYSNRKGTDDEQNFPEAVLNKPS